MNIFAQQPRKHLLNFQNTIVQNQRSSLQDLTPAECEQLTGQTGRAVRRLRDLINSGCDPPLELRATGSAARHIRNHGQQIIEIVCHTAGESAHRFQLLGIA